MNVSSIEFILQLVNETLKDQAWRLEHYRKENAELKEQIEKLKKGDNEQ